MRAALRRAMAQTRRDTAFLAAGIPLHLAAVPLWIWYAGPVFRAVPAVAPVPAALVFAGAVPLTAVQRWRYRTLLVGAGFPRLPGTRGRPGPRRALQWLRSQEAWCQVGYHAVAGPVLAAMELLVMAVGAAAVTATTVYIWVWALPPDWRLSQFGYATQAAYITVGGAVALCAAPWAAGTVARIETRVAWAMLGPGRTRELQRRVADLTQSRAGVVDAADAERRRIERDLHDGAQQHLVSLAVNLGLAKATLTSLPDDARRVIEEAHQEAKAAIAALSDLVRGLHPAVLEDRGLDAALSGLIARIPLPVRLRVGLDRRLSPTVEAVAYFVASEALTNVTKHACATRAEVTVERIGAMLRVTVTDDGAGGADASGGTGLTGLANRVSSVDGTFRIRSPTGGPTTITAELPCEP
jgi:signal transduction histidine kinase